MPLPSPPSCCSDSAGSPAGDDSFPYTCIVGRQKLAQRLIAFEPDRAVVVRLRDHIALNGLTSVEIHETAVGASRHRAALSLGAPGYDALSSVVSAHPGGYEIDVVTLDDTLAFVGKSLVIKIDVEGYELEVLHGAKNLLARNYGYA